jgi:hypothetical protein
LSLRGTSIGVSGTTGESALMKLCLKWTSVMH